MPDMFTTDSRSSKRAGEAVTELRRAVFFAGPDLGASGKSENWWLRAWVRYRRSALFSARRTASVVMTGSDAFPPVASSGATCQCANCTSP